MRDFLFSVPYFLFSVRTFQALSVRAFWGLGRGVFVFCALLFVFCALISGTFCARFWWVGALDLMSCARLSIFCALFGTPLFTGAFKGGMPNPGPHCVWGVGARGFCFLCATFYFLCANFGHFLCALLVGLCAGFNVLCATFYFLCGI